MPTELAAHVIVTSIFGTFHVTDVIERRPFPPRRWFSDSPVALTDEPSLVFGMTASGALDNFRNDGIARDVWLIQGGVVSDHACIR